MNDLISRENIEMKLMLNSPITEEQWDAITDIDFDHTSEVMFRTKHGKEIVFVKKKKGHWMNDDGIFICSCCNSGYEEQPTLMGKPMFEWCPVCGAKMEGLQNEQPSGDHYI